jgi:hypothetical protein
MRHLATLRHRILVRMSAEMTLAIDVWRGRQPGVPNRAEAIRRLLQIALNAPSPTCHR